MFELHVIALPQRFLLFRSLRSGQLRLSFRKLCLCLQLCKLLLLALQLFNAIFIGIIAGIGMLWFQDLMPGRAGAVTTLFTNSISTGVILAGVMQGALSQSYGHASVYWTIAAISLVTLFLTSKVKDI